MPPGPPRQFKPVRGRSSASLPLWKRFALLQKEYGSVVSLFQGNTPVIVLGTIKAATDLLEKKGGIYSSRPRSIMVGELLSDGMRGVMMPYGTRWRNWRSVMHAGMSVEASNAYKSFQSMESKILIHDLLLASNSRQYSAFLRRFAISVVLRVSYGRRIQSLNDPIVVANTKIEECKTPGKYIVESWPILLKLPRFLQWFRREPEEQLAHDTELYLSFANEVRRQMSLGIALPSTGTRALEKQEDFGLNDVETAFALSSPFSAGVGTTLSTLDVFFLAMLHYPDTMKKAQSEIDIVVGRSRLPEFDDVESLPYIRALILETMRWRPIVPVCVPHSVISDDTYEGMHIPRGSSVYPNISYMSKNEEMFPSADDFKPERYLKSANLPTPHTTFFFGFGRRICPGIHIANNSLYIVISRILWAFNIVPNLDEHGKAVIPSKDDFTTGLSIRPKPFTYHLETRNGKDTVTLIEEEWKTAEQEATAYPQ
ncbi:Cytochrome P450 monooxygenase 58 [Psilocybe cubensis]|uniref:Cytochrome P450 monooxygenase 58 n=1 Tax=Psilocybe cubensis TaxID=181762 RepID=A0ACB8H9V3_PSICU|nr:Cytochrome P450 monooxygenase 58 [Psilocybe cubensis]KAH9484588.1 Cytochrome P450 monooxygenase 58 [Psilocybe cubensis]